MLTKQTASLAFTVLLAAQILLTTACGSEPLSPEDGTITETPETETTADAGPKLDLPESDYSGQTFTILSSDVKDYEYVAEEQNGDIVSDAVYVRNRNVEELLNIDIGTISLPGDWANRETFNAAIRNSVMADDGAYDLVSGVTVIVLPTGSEGLYINANDLNYIDFSKPWWVQGMNEDLAIQGKLFGFIGDASLSLYKDLSVFYFNKNILASYDLEDPYDLVRNGKWTLDAFYGMTKNVGNDLNGDGVMKKGDDLFGYLYANVPNRAMQTATEYQIISFDKDGTPAIAPLSDRDAELYFKVFDFLLNNENVYGEDPSSSHPEFSSIFANDQALFMCEFIYATDYLRDMKSDFGIIPMPKRDEEQKDYHTQIGTSTSMYFVPTTAPDPDLTAKFCESACFYSWRDVTPVYYEVALKEKYTRDEDVKEMLNIIRNSAQMDFVFAYSTMFNPFINEMLPGCFAKKTDSEVSSKYAKNQSAWEKVIANLMESYNSIES